MNFETTKTDGMVDVNGAAIDVSNAEAIKRGPAQPLEQS